MMTTMQRTRKTFGIATDFTAAPRRQRAQHLVADGAAGADLTGVVIFAPGRDVIIHDVYLTPDGTGVGVDDSNTSVWNVTDGSNTVVTKTYDSSTPFPADGEQDALGPAAFGYLAAGGRLELSITNGATANLPACLVTVEYSDAAEMLGPEFKIIATDDGTVSLSGGAAGIVEVVASDADVNDNDEIYIASALALFEFAAGKPLVAECRLQFEESAPGVANVLFGFMSNVGANSLLDNGGGPKSSYSGAVFCKVDGETTWQTEASIGATQTTTVSTKTAGGASYQTLRIEARPVPGGTTAKVWYFVDGVRLVDDEGAAIEHVIDFATATDMQLVVGLKNGSAAAETLRIDYLEARQAR